MKNPKLSLAMLMLLILMGCYSGITGRVIDSETQQPIENAIVIAQWVKTRCLGECGHTVYKIVCRLGKKLHLAQQLSDIDTLGFICSVQPNLQVNSSFPCKLQAVFVDSCVWLKLQDCR